ncbi:MAG: hemerythrin domain-containing protein [Parvularculaceae bacterium]
MTTIIDDLAKDHARFRRYLISFREEIAKLARGEEADFALLQFLATYFSQFPDELHHKKEDIIYARLEARMRPQHDALENLHEQHAEISERAGRFAQMMRAVLGEQAMPIGHIVEEAESYAALLGHHMESEDRSLFEPARRQFSKSDWEIVNDGIADLYAVEINFDKAREVLRLEKLLDNFLQQRIS